MKKRKNYLRSMKNVLALIFFMLSFVCFVVQAAEPLPCCYACDPFCVETNVGEGWRGCTYDDRPGHEECTLEFWGICIDCDI